MKCNYLLMKCIKSVLIVYTLLLLVVIGLLLNMLNDILHNTY